MAMFGNGMFGHHLELEAHASQMGTGFGGGGHSFGASHKKSGIGGPSFGSSCGYSNDPNAIMLQQSHPELAANYGYHGSFLMRQNSLLSEMTQSKSERKKHPFSSASNSYCGNTENSLLSYSLFNEGHKPKKPPLQRGTSMTGEPDEEDMEDKPFLGKRPRAPSFASDPYKMRSKTIGGLGAGPPPTRPKPRITRSMSINEDLITPANMDIAGPILKRQQSLDAEKMRRKSLQLPKRSFLHLPGKRRRSLRSQSDKDGSSGMNSETSSMYGPPRSRSSTYNSRPSSGTDSPKRSPSIGSQSSKQSENTVIRRPVRGNSQDEAKLILSLMNDPVPEPVHDSVFESPSPDEGKPPPKFNHHTAIPIDSPSLVSKRIQQMRQMESDNESVSSNNPRGTKPNGPSRPNSARSPVMMLAEGPLSPRRTGPPPTRYPFYPDPNDSDVSEPYYDCKSRQSSDPYTTCSEPYTDGKSRLNSPLTDGMESPKPGRPNYNSDNPHDTSASTWTDGEETTSTCETPPRKTYPGPQRTYDSPPPMYLPNVQMNNEKNKPRYQGREAETIHVANNVPKGMTNENQRPNITKKMSNESLHKPTMHQTPVIALTQPLLADVKPERRDHHESGESSESGYATSHKPLSPKDYHLKVSQYVRSLPSNPDIDEHHSETDHDVKNGSLTDLDDIHGRKGHYKPARHGDINDINCVSGSESDDDGHRSDGNVSESKLEVMKLLESPTNVRARVADDLVKKRDDPSYTGHLPSPASLYRKGSKESVREDIKPQVENKLEAAKPEKKHVEVNCVISGPPESPRSDQEKSRVFEPARQQSIAANIFERFNSIGRPYSSTYETKSTSCIDVLLHFANLLIFLTSAGIIAVAIWLLLKTLNINDICLMLGDNLLQILVYVAIAGASMGLLASFCLCCGVRNDRNGLGVYGFALVLVTVTFATTAVLATIFSDKLGGLDYSYSFKERLLTLYGVPQDLDSKVFTQAWDNMQTEFQCCGAHDQDEESWALYSRTQWFQNHPDRGYIFVPESCCRRNTNIRVCQGGDSSILGPPRYIPNSIYRDSNENLNNNGCYPFLASYLKTLSKGFAMCTGILAGLYFLIVMLTWVFCFKKNKDYNEYMDYADSYLNENEEVYNNDETLRLAIRDSENHEPEKSNMDETKFISTPVKPGKSSMKTVSELPNGLHNVRHENMNHVRSVSDYHVDSDDEHHDDHDDHSRHSEEQHSDNESSSDDDDASTTLSDDTITRRNMWLTSSTGGHLLSQAIEEEDSNLEETDDDSPRQTAYV